MEPPVLTNKDIPPTDDIIYEHIGAAKRHWLALFEFLHSTHPDIAGQWRYYNDGKSWLFKATRKTKTIFWLSVIEGTFRTTFYLTDKAKRAIQDSKLSDPLKEQFAAGKKYGKIKGITIIYKNKRDVEDAKALIALKLSLK
jgi:hypothetical protein